MKCANRSKLAAYVGMGLHIILGLLQLLLVSIIFLIVCYNNYYYKVENYKCLSVIPIFLFSAFFLLRGFYVLMRADTVPVSSLERPSYFIAGTQVILFVSFLYLRSFFDKPTEHFLTILSSIFYSLDMIFVVPCLVATFILLKKVEVDLGCKNEALFV